MDQLGAALALTLIGTLPFLAGAEEPAQDSGRPPPRIAIAGFQAIDCASTVVYAGAPGTPHRLCTTYAFPDRARWWLGTGDEHSPERQMRLRFGDALYAIDKSGGASRELLAEERTEALVQLEMRRALLLWPDGFEWKREGNESRAVLARTGRLTARFADDKARTPVALEFTAEDGRPGDALRAITWREDKGKSWPVSLELWHEKARTWTETFQTIETKTRFIDSYFLPPDRRDAGTSKPLEVGAVRATDVPECRVQRVALKAGATLEDALAEWKQVAETRAQELAPRGFALDDKLTLEIGPDAQPRALLVRLAPAKTTLPEDLAKTYALVPERPALTTFVMGLGAVSAAQYEKLKAAVPPDAQAGPAYLRLDPQKPAEHVLIVLPLVPAGK